MAYKTAKPRRIPTTIKPPKKQGLLRDAIPLDDLQAIGLTCYQTLATFESPPLDRLDSYLALEKVLNEFLSQAIADARAVGIKWAEIGRSLNLAASGAQYRFAQAPQPDAFPFWKKLGDDLERAHQAEKDDRAEMVRLIAEKGSERKRRRP